MRAKRFLQTWGLAGWLAGCLLFSACGQSDPNSPDPSSPALTPVSTQIPPTADQLLDEEEASFISEIASIRDGLEDGTISPRHDDDSRESLLEFLDYAEAVAYQQDLEIELKDEVEDVAGFSADVASMPLAIKVEYFTRAQAIAMTDPELIEDGFEPHAFLRVWLQDDGQPWEQRVEQFKDDELRSCPEIESVRWARQNFDNLLATIRLMVIEE